MDTTIAMKNNVFVVMGDGKCNELKESRHGCKSIPNPSEFELLQQS